MKKSVSTSVKNYRFEKSGKNRFYHKGITLTIIAFLMFSINPDAQAQQMVSTNVPITTDLNILERFEFAQSLEADAYTIKGTVLDEENLPLGGVNVVLKGTHEGTVTDFDGTFEFPRTLNVGETLVFSYLGYDKKEYTVAESESDVIDITIAFDASDIILMGAVEVEGVYPSKRNIFQKFASLFKK